jgi:hypothetical protein
MTPRDVIGRPDVADCFSARREWPLKIRGLHIWNMWIYPIGDGHHANIHLHGDLSAMPWSSARGIEGSPVAMDQI